MIHHFLKIPTDLPLFSQFSDLIQKACCRDASLSSPLFYDIETTGSQRSSDPVYLIGMVWEEQGHWEGLQLLAETPEEEPELLKQFREQLKKHTLTIQYYGDRFDQPFLEERYRVNGIASPFENLPSLDLHRLLHPYKNGLALKDFKQTSLEAFLNVPPRKHPDGRKCIQIYQASLLTPRTAYSEALLGHNEEDLLGMIQILHLLPCLQFSVPSFMVTEILMEGESLHFGVTYEQEICGSFSLSSPLFSFTAKGCEGQLQIPISSGAIRNFYRNYKDYDYLPEEDTALPKSLSAGLSRSSRRKATPETCYTWIPLTEDFLRDFSIQDQYVNHNLPILVSL